MREQWHYVYYSYEPWGRGYIGKRTSRVPPDLDPYMGSFADTTFSPTEKIVLDTFDTAMEAIQAEIILHRYYEVDRNPHFANRSRQTSTGFCCPSNPLRNLSEQQKIARSRKISAAHSAGSRGFFYQLTSPSGKIIVTLNLRKTCKEHGLNRGNLCQVLQGKRAHSQGWTICKLQLT